MDSGSGGMVLANMTKNSYVAAREVVTSFTSGTEEDKEKDHTYEALPCEANEEGQEDTTPGDQGDAAVGGHGGSADDVHVYANTADGVHVYANQ